ncbi:hypothetical protein ACO2Q8_10730 [Larkinella sp. VNQ87]|uniref:hypothetical protein n=1 Tax=Larkinella sp. VNQ87 TaxID=3400921 RepID=UPI003C106119
MLFRKLKVIWLFYRQFGLASNLVTVALIGVSLERIKDYFPLFIVYFLWFKLLSNGIIGYLTRRMFKDRFWFYYNLGLSETALFGGAFALDFLITLLLIFTTYQLLLRQ